MKSFAMFTALCAAIIIFNGCITGTGIYRTDPATAEFYGTSIEVHQCTLMKSHPLFGAFKSLSLIARLPDDTTQPGLLLLSFIYIEDNWAFVKSLEIKIGDTIYPIIFNSPSRTVQTFGSVMCTETGTAIIPVHIILKMLSNDTSFRFIGKVYPLTEKHQRNLQEWWDNIPSYWKHRMQMAANK